MNSFLYLDPIHIEHWSYMLCTHTSLSIVAGMYWSLNGEQLPLNTTEEYQCRTTNLIS